MHKWIAVATIVFALAAAGQSSHGPSPTPSKEAQGNQNQASKVRSEPHENQQATSSASPTLTQPSAVVTTGNQPDPRSIKKDHPAKDHPANNWWEIVGTIAGVVNTILLTLFSGALALLAYRQWRAMDRQAKLMHRQAVLIGRQLAEMKTTSVDTHALAVAAKDAAESAKEQSTRSEYILETMRGQESAILLQARIMTTQADAAILSAQTAQRGVWATLKQLETYDRPWVVVSLEPHTHLKGEELGPWVTPWLTLTNTGRSVATDVRYQCRMLPELGGSYMESASQAFQSSGQAIFPGERSINPLPLAVPDDMMPFAAVVVEDDDRYVRLRIEGEVTYRYATSESMHTTRFAYHVGRYEKSKARIVVKIGETIPPDEITFLRDPLASYAD